MYILSASKHGHGAERQAHCLSAHGYRTQSQRSYGPPPPASARPRILAAYPAHAPNPHAERAALRTLDESTRRASNTDTQAQLSTRVRFGLAQRACGTGCPSSPHARHCPGEMHSLPHRDGVLDLLLQLSDLLLLRVNQILARLRDRLVRRGLGNFSAGAAGLPRVRSLLPLLLRLLLLLLLLLLVGGGLIVAVGHLARSSGGHLVKGLHTPEQLVIISTRTSKVILRVLQL